MPFLGTTYCIKEGDNLWDIAAKHMGNPYAWSSIYAFNNLPDVIASGATKIKDPDLIFAGHQLNLPIIKGAALPKCEDVNAKLVGSLKDQLPDLPPVPMSIVFKLPDTPIGVYKVGAFTATVALKGTVTMSSKNAMPISKIIDGGYVATGRKMANKALGMLMSEPKLSFDGKKALTFSNKMTIAAKGGTCPTTSVELGVSSTGKPVTKIALNYPQMRGTVGKYNFVAMAFKVEVEIEPDEKPNLTPVDFSPKSVPVFRPIMAPGLPSFQVNPDIVKASISVAGAIMIAVELVGSWATRLFVPPGLYLEQQFDPMYGQPEIF